MKNAKRLTAYMIREGKDGESFWTQVGVAFVNRDGSINVLLDAVPLTGKLQLREPKQSKADKGDTDDSPET